MRSGVVAAVLMTRGFLYIISKCTRFYGIFLCAQTGQCFRKQLFNIRQGVQPHKKAAHFRGVGEILYPISGCFPAAVYTNAFAVIRNIFADEVQINFKPLCRRIAGGFFAFKSINNVLKDKRIANGSAPNHYPGASGL